MRGFTHKPIGLCNESVADCVLPGTLACGLGREQRIYGAVGPQVSIMKEMLKGLRVKASERTWLRHQTEGVWDEGKLVEGLTGEQGRPKGAGSLSSSWRTALPGSGRSSSAAVRRRRPSAGRGRGPGIPCEEQ